MKKILAVCCALVQCFRLKPIKAYAWSGTTHEDITKKALALLEKEKKLKQATFYKDYHSQLLKGCTEPDGEKDMDKGPGKHYYACVNPKGKELPDTKGYYRNRLGNLNESARTMLEENYTAAVSLYKSGDIDNAMRVLGRAIHFVSDMGCTVHVANMKYQDKANNVHFAFERHVTTTCTSHTANSFDKRLLKYYDKDGFGEASNKLVKYAAKFVDTISHLDPRAFDDVAKNTLPVTQQNVMALLLKFYDDCTADNGNYIVNGKAYTFKNEVSGLILTVTPKGLQLEKADKELEQKLTVCLTEDGTFGLKIGDGGYVNASCKGYDYIKLDGQPVQFRVAALGKRRFRISTESTDYIKMLANSKGGKLSFADFDPENPAQIWIMN
ncbi:zinc dependent phospholipase C family protein [Ruminococcus sp.]|uniref:zinc dependent phospholipase C family protein n=1 Tax=Ruminococcus sp. TaxID=41978 RepID=UPI0025DE7074|nr:zinc dependent phospholipase C family protein [Ruminococcus sp.]